MSDRSRYELVLLRLVEEGAGHWSWYNIEIRLSNMSVPRDPDALQVLKDLADKGLVIRHVTEGSARDRWELTDDGRRHLDAESKRAEDRLTWE